VCATYRDVQGAAIRDAAALSVRPGPGPVRAQAGAVDNAFLTSLKSTDTGLRGAALTVAARARATVMEKRMVLAGSPLSTKEFFLFCK
jgi:hypothetical protein